MKGIRPGRGSAGRSDCKACGYKEPKRDGFRDVRDACDGFTKERIGCLSNWEIYQQDAEWRF